MTAFSLSSSGSHAGARVRLAWTHYVRSWPWVPIVLIVGLIMLVWLGVALNGTSHRIWNVGLGIIPSIAAILLITNPTILKWVIPLSIVEEVADLRNTPREAVRGALKDYQWLAQKLSHIVLFLQTLFVVMALKRFESAEAVILAIVALLGIGVLEFTSAHRAKIYRPIMVGIWTALLIGSLLYAFFIPNYFADDVRFELFGAQAHGEREWRQQVKGAQASKFAENGDLSTSEWARFQRVNTQEHVNSTIQEVIRHSFTVTIPWDGRPEQTVPLLVTAGDYTFKAATVSKRDIVVDGTNVDFASLVLLNGQAQGNLVTVGPNGKAGMSFAAGDAFLKAARDLGIKSIKVTLTPT